MDRHFLAYGWALTLIALWLTQPLSAATFETENFRVQASSTEVAKAAAELAEEYRKSLAVDWFGEELPAWEERCVITIRISNSQPTGDTTFYMDRTRVGDWRISLSGPVDDLLESVLPHEVSHTVFATHFRRSLPRWADEGAATLCEDELQRMRQRYQGEGLIKNGQHYLPLKKMLPMLGYPRSNQGAMAVYVQGYLLVDFLVQSRGRAEFVDFLQEAHASNWEKAVQHNYGYDSIEMLEESWREWVKEGCPSMDDEKGRRWVKAAIVSSSVGE